MILPSIQWIIWYAWRTQRPCSMQNYIDAAVFVKPVAISDGVAYIAATADPIKRKSYVYCVYKNCVLTELWLEARNRVFEHTKTIRTCRRVHFCWVQFKAVSMRSEKLIIMRSTPCLNFPQRCLWNSSNVHLTDDGPFLSVEGRIIERVFFLRLSFSGNRLCDVIGFVVPCV